MLTELKRILIGPPLPTREIKEKRLPKWRALAAFSPDALSSIAYANQEIYLGLVMAGSAGLSFAWPSGSYTVYLYISWLEIGLSCIMSGVLSKLPNLY